ncbi:MAG TPA: hypothetical protein VK081_13705 [Planctomycetota bacterium]|nr:hypothetical protein [Planctomycetota bacterium]
MRYLRRAIGSLLLISLASSAVAAQDKTIRLSADPLSQSLRVHTEVAGFVYLVLGHPVGIPPIRIGEIELDVSPLAILPLGKCGAGEVRELFVPRALSEFWAEAVHVEDMRLRDSNFIALLDAFPDLITATFRAELVSTDGIPPIYSVGISLTAPTTGYELQFDGADIGDTTEVWFRLIEPNDRDYVMPVLTVHSLGVELGTEVGSMVRVHLMRIPRGGVIGAYKKMAELPVVGGG